MQPPRPRKAESRSIGHPLVDLRGVSFWYPGAEDAAPALAGLDVTLPAGELALVCGPSGGGKSTLLRLCLGLVPQFTGGRLAGDVEVVGRDPTTLPPRQIAAAGVALLFQNPVEGFVAERVGEEVAFGPENLGLSADEVDARVAQALEAVGLAGAERRRLRTLSAGEQQRAALAAALALRPRLLLLDEPTAHLDPRTARVILELIARLHREVPTTVVLSEHRLGMAAPMADRVLVLVDGRLLADGPPRGVFADPGLSALGVPVPRATLAAVRLGLPPPLPLTPAELAAAALARRAAPPSPPRPTPGLEPAGRGLPGPEATGSRPSGPEPSGQEVAGRRPPGGGPLGQADLWRQPADERAAAAPPTVCVAPERAGRPLLRFENVSFTYPGTTSPALSAVSLELRAGEVAALVGPTGAGKSTLARLALGLLVPTDGQVELAGLSTRSTPFPELARQGGLVLQNPLLQLLAERVDDELWLGLKDLPPEQARRRVERLLREFDLGPLRARHPLALSEGQRRRVALAATLVREPRVLVLDEPTLGQDERQRLALATIVQSLARVGAAVLAISHDPEFVNDACDRVLVLRAGRLTADLPLSLAIDAPARLLAAGVPLGDVPATAVALEVAGCPVRGRSVDDLVAALA